MPKNRRGGPLGAASAAKISRVNGATMQSRNGSASPIPAARRNRRRDRGRRRDANGPWAWGWVVGLMRSLALEQLALDQLFDERAHAELAGLRPRQDRLNLGSVGEAGRRSGGENRELSHQVPRHGGLVFQEQSLELSDVLERLTVGQLTGRIDRRAPMELQLLTVHAVPLDRRHAIGDGAVARAERA